MLTGTRQTDAQPPLVGQQRLAYRDTPEPKRAKLNGNAPRSRNRQHGGSSARGVNRQPLRSTTGSSFTACPVCCKQVPLPCINTHLDIECAGATPATPAVIPSWTGPCGASCAPEVRGRRGGPDCQAEQPPAARPLDQEAARPVTGGEWRQALRGPGRAGAGAFHQAGAVAVALAGVSTRPEVVEAGPDPAGSEPPAPQAAPSGISSKGQLLPRQRQQQQQQQPLVPLRDAGLLLQPRPVLAPQRREGRGEAQHGHVLCPQQQGLHRESWSESCGAAQGGVGVGGESGAACGIGVGLGVVAGDDRFLWSGVREDGSDAGSGGAGSAGHDCADGGNGNDDNDDGDGDGDFEVVCLGEVRAAGFAAGKTPGAVAAMAAATSAGGETPHHGAAAPPPDALCTRGRALVPEPLLAAAPMAVDGAEGSTAGCSIGDGKCCERDVHADRDGGGECGGDRGEPRSDAQAGRWGAGADGGSCAGCSGGMGGGGAMASRALGQRFSGPSARGDQGQLGSHGRGKGPPGLRPLGQLRSLQQLLQLQQQQQQPWGTGLQLQQQVQQEQMLVGDGQREGHERPSHQSVGSAESNEAPTRKPHQSGDAAAICVVQLTVQAAVAATGMAAPAAPAQEGQAGGEQEKREQEERNEAWAAEVAAGEEGLCGGSSSGGGGGRKGAMVAVAAAAVRLEPALAQEAPAQEALAQEAPPVVQFVMLPTVRHPALEGQVLVPDFVTREEEAELLALCDDPALQPPWSPWAGLSYANATAQKTRGKRWGVLPDYHRRGVGPPKHPLPPLLRLLAERMRARVGVLKSFRPNEANAIDYRRSQGSWLRPHVDDRILSGDFVVTLSLAGPAVMSFARDHRQGPGGRAVAAAARTEAGPAAEVRVRLEPRSLQVLSKAARYSYMHAIAPGDLLGERRVSITFRRSELRPFETR